MPVHDIAGARPGADLATTTVPVLLTNGTHDAPASVEDIRCPC